MSVTLLVCVLGMVAIGALGLLGRRRPAASLEEWSVGGRNFGAFTTWLLQAGEIYTTFTFLGLAGLACTSGVAVTYALPYLPLAYVGLYAIAPVIWRMGRDRGYLTQGDFFADRYGSRLFGGLTSVLGVVFLLPYLQLQITGLGLVIQLATGNKDAGTPAMIAASVLVVAFVLWSGIQGVAKAAYLKDALMVVALLVLLVMVPAHYSGGIGHLGAQLREHHSELLSVPAGGPFGQVWFFTAMLTSLFSVLFLTMPQGWAPVLAAGSERALRKNSIWIPVYGATQAIPMIVGFTALTTLSGAASANGNGVLLQLASGAMPDWLLGVIAVAAAATAMVPSAGIVLGMSTLVARNVLRPRGARAGLLVNHGTVVIAVTLALVLGIARPDALANLLLLTYSGLGQMAPATAAALTRRPLLRAWSAGAGIVVGEAVLIWLTFGDSYHGAISTGLISLAVNVVVAVAVELVLRARGGAPVLPDEPSAPSSASAPATV
ncbi:sodium:solute symporter family protein [Streptomyces sp. 110]|uniref:Sodium:solute symporter family protein n=1 Tax=Streptomyces endocoffeicus TaxID=2898945 RepID=A0ABS1Q550_9ACTN|nr:sodium:solute symporter family protein [Streptomyces endocoffeicus]MBL1119810.1 sodium:solute symporter family protein [Streptomyces endocoffeicus]